MIKIKSILSLLAFCSISIANASTVNIIQYNVKGDIRSARDHGIWSQNSLRSKELDLINSQIQSKPVDFIALEQAITDTHHGATPLLDDELKSHYGLTNWKTYVNTNHLTSGDFDETEITFNTNRWKVLPNTTTPGNYWTTDNNNGVRPYNMIYLEGTAKDNSGEKVLFVALHFPHYGSAAYWNTKQFIQDAQNTVGSGTKLTNVTVILAGDMNEVGDANGNASRLNSLKDFKTTFGAFKISSINDTCCQNTQPRKYSLPYDQVATNHSNATISGYVINPSSEIYPNHPNSEEHKAVYATITLN
ncbi:MAG: hypothetical protein EP298_08525 [Gammaproteobacteria bacterium]|nr:MAG: hypothetical protein EP298_08525 [Gammaproteobacteria bacterium]UTW42831.1 hypothetical protein KFE69_01435 [bacterium SCSIO 12844]